MRSNDIDLELEENRYSRLKLIPWWDQERLLNSRVMVVGAGALGNEIIKNLALLGVGNILIVDFDRIENSNLSRSVLFRSEDEGKSKAEVAAKAAKEINPDVCTVAIDGDVSNDVGLGTFRAMDLVIAGLDSREARLAVNQACWQVGTPWIDGAIEALYGVARVFIPPHGPCYECTMNEMDRRIVSLRQSCALLTKDELLEGKIPTTPTTAAVIAGIQTQEAVKLLHARDDLPTLAGRGFFFNGLGHDSFVVEYEKRDDCLSHDTFEVVEDLQMTSDATLGELLEAGRKRIGSEVILEFGREIVTSLECRSCETREEMFVALARITTDDAVCRGCGAVRVPELTHSITMEDDNLSLSMREIGLPLYDIVTISKSGRTLGESDSENGSSESSNLDMIHFELSADRSEALGDCA